MFSDQLPAAVVWWQFASGWEGRSLLLEGEWLLPWWHHQMETFSVLLAICARNSPVTGEFPAQRPVMRSFDVFFDLRLNKRLSKQWWGLWFEMPSRSFWRHFKCNDKKEFNTLWPSDAIWRHRSASLLDQIMACCLMGPSHYLNQCWLIINEVLWHSPEGTSLGNAQDTYP